MNQLPVKIATIVSVPFEENSYILHRDGAREAVVCDPGLEPQKILNHLDSEGLTPVAILCTHGHSDHIAGNAAIKSRWPECRLIIGAGDAPKLTSPELNLSAAFGAHLLSPPADETVTEGDTLDFAGIQFDVYETPGHSAGHVVFVLRGTAPLQVLAGDVLFRGSVGRTDFPDGSFEALRAAIQEKLFVLPDDTIIFPGHGPVTTVGVEKRTNPFVNALTK